MPSTLLGIFGNRIVQRPHRSSSRCSSHRGAVKIHIYGALGKASGAALQRRALDFCLSGAVRSQDLIYIPMAMATSGKAGADAVFSWMQSEYSRIYEMIGATSMMLFQNMVRVSGAGFVTEGKADEVSAFWKSRDLYKNIEKALAQTVEGIKSNSKFVDRQGKLKNRGMRLAASRVCPSKSGPSG